MRRKSYAQERRVFDRLRLNCSEEAKKEYETAVATLLSRYNTTIYEYRFTAGGAVKFLTYALLRSVGIDCTPDEDQSHPGDILLSNGRKFLVKGVFTGGPDRVRLMNKLGEGHQTWDTATLFVVSDVGLVYGSRDMVAEEYIKDVNDGTVLTRAGLQYLIGIPDNLFKVKIARKPPAETAGSNEKAREVAWQILSEMQAERLYLDQ